MLPLFDAILVVDAAAAAATTPCLIVYAAIIDIFAAAMPVFSFTLAARCAIYARRFIFCYARHTPRHFAIAPMLLIIDYFGR